MNESPKFSKSEFDDEIDWSLNFRDSSMQSKYGMFKVFASSQTGNTYVSGALTLLFVMYWFCELCFGTFTNLTGFASIATMLLVFVPLWISAGLRRIVLQSSQTALIQKFLTLLESWTIVGLAIALGWIVFSTSELETFLLYQRQPLAETDRSFKCLVIASFAGQLLFFLPILAPIYFTFASWRAVVLMSVIPLMCTIGAAIALSTKAAVLRLLAFTLLACIIQYSGRMQQMRLFQCMANYNESIEKRAKESQEAGIKLKEETRNMVASFCHDMKTPLAALAAGLETVSILLSQLQNDMQAKSAGRQIDAAVIQQSMDSFESTIAHMSATFQLTLMAVNRAADCSKAKYDMELGPIFETFHLQLAVDTVVSHIRSLFTDESISVESLPEEVSDFIVTDRNWLIEGLMELSLNAIKHSSDHKAILHVQFVQGSEMIEMEGVKKCRRQAAEEYDGEQFLRFVVEDNGDELSEQEVEAAFQPTDFSKQRDDGGLKASLLCLAKRNAALGGCCGMSPLANELQGTRAWFAVPYRAAEQPLKSPQASLVASVGTIAWESGGGADQSFDSGASTDENAFDHYELGLSTPIRVLVVDDAITITKMLARQFEHSHGYHVELASNGQLALVKIFTVCLDSVKRAGEGEEEDEKNNFNSPMKCSSDSAEIEHPQREQFEKNFDVILMDIQMPIMDGLTAIREIRARETDRDRHLIIAMSANSDHSTVVDAYAAGADYFLQKPCKLMSVQHLLREYFTRQKRESEGTPELQL